jgi:hypothetical protein
MRNDLRPLAVVFFSPRVLYLRDSNDSFWENIFMNHTAARPNRRSMRHLQMTSQSPAALAQLQEERILRILRITDRIQFGAFVLAFLLAIAVHYTMKPTELISQMILVPLTVVVFGAEAWMAYKTKRGYMRIRTVMLVGIYGWGLACPLILGISVDRYSLDVNSSEVFFAETIILLFASLLYAGYMLRGSKRGFLTRTFEDIVPRVSPEFAFWMCVACFVPQLIQRFVFIDWSRTENIVMALLGQDGNARFDMGQFGDSRSIWRPATYLWELFAIVAVVAFVKCKGRLDLQVIILMMYAFNVFSLTLQWSRYKLAQALLAPIMVLFCVWPARRYKYLFGAALLAVLLYVQVSSLMLSGRAGGWFRASMRGFGRVQSADKTMLVEDNVSVLAHTLKVVPSREPYLPFYDMYYFVLVNPIPRFLWKNKPYVSEEYIGDRRPHYCAVTLAGDAYICGGWWHVVVASLGLGALIRTIDNFAKPWRPMETETALIFLACAWLCLILVRSIYAMMQFGLPVIFFLGLLYLVRLVRGRRARRPKLRRRVMRQGARATLPSPAGSFR